ncbi:MAG TPA: hypothetical protein VMY78_08325 [Solirubrobacteraceae bacterium]|nr:hypothetical protein [Solirubrobacteraceae bacterium]
MSAPDRTGYGARQSALLGALLAGGDPPEGFAAAQAAAAGGSLRRKRGRVVAGAWPALFLDAGDRFDAYARELDTAGDPVADGLAFARWLGVRNLGDDARVEVLLARASLRRVFVGAARLDGQVLLVARMPGVGIGSSRLRTARDRH